MVSASLEQLVGAHPAALRDFYRGGKPCDPVELRAAAGEASGDARGHDGLLLAIEPLGPAHLAARPIVSLLARHAPWRGKSFESGGTSGQDVVLGRRMFRFRCEVGCSALDDEAALLLRYDDLGNPWPVSRVQAELRAVGQGVHIGPAFWLAPGGRRQLWWWWGLA